MLRQSGSDDRPALLCQAEGLAMMILLKAASSQNAWVESEWCFSRSIYHSVFLTLERAQWRCGFSS